MECKEIRDRFSSLLEGELPPAEERELRNHLSACSGCERDFLKFEKTIGWLRSVEEVEVPEGFLSGLHEKLEERKRKGAPAEKVGWRLFSYPSRVKLPLQAMAMVAVLFLVFYVTKMTPVEMVQKKEIPYPQRSLSEEKEAKTLFSPPAAPGQKEPERFQAPSIQKERADQRIALKKPEKEIGKPAPILEPKKQDEDLLAFKKITEEPAPSPKAEVSQPQEALKPAEKPAPIEPGAEAELKKDLREPEILAAERREEDMVIARREVREKERLGRVVSEVSSPSPDARKIRDRQYVEKKGEATVHAGKAAPLPSPPAPQEIILKISDREKFLGELYDLVAELGGDVLHQEENVILASVPTAAFPEFEKKLNVLSPVKEPASPGRPPVGKLKSVHKPKTIEEKDKDVKTREPDREGRVSIRIRILQE